MDFISGVLRPRSLSLGTDTWGSKKWQWIKAMGGRRYAVAYCFLQYMNLGTSNEITQGEDQGNNQRWYFKQHVKTEFIGTGYCGYYKLLWFQKQINLRKMFKHQPQWELWKDGVSQSKT